MPDPHLEQREPARARSARGRRHRREVPRGVPLPVQRHGRTRARSSRALAQKFGARTRTSCSAPARARSSRTRCARSPRRPSRWSPPGRRSRTRATPRRRSARRCAKWRFDGKLRIDIAKMVEASKGAGLVFFCNPNNPTATVHGKTAVADMVKAIRAASPDTVILIDEAYHDYVTDPSYQSAMRPGARDAERVRDAHLLEGLRHGRPARRLRHRPRADDQGHHGLQDALRPRHAHAGRRHRRRWPTRRTSTPSASATPT